jgi:esterase
MTGAINFSVTGDGPAVVLMHGLFGAGNNLGALSRFLRDNYRVYSLDLPNHGRSAWREQAGPQAMAEVVSIWMDAEGVESASLVGHSLGGKVAMELALSQQRRISGLVVADIAPVAYPAHHDAVFAALDAVLEAGCQTREEAAAVMADHLPEPDVIQFLLMGLQRSGDRSYGWRFNLEGIKRDYAAVRAAPESGRHYPGPALFIKGGASDYILPEHREQVLSLFPLAAMKVMPGCGHWLHAEQPAQFNGIVGRFLDRLHGHSGP